jgi:hypothetical protein
LTIRTLVVIALWSGFPVTPAIGQLAFTDIGLAVGVGQAGLLTESVAWGDYDGDGDEDLFLTNNGPNALFRNDGSDTFTNVTTATGLVDGGLFSVGGCFGDLDNDGDLDLYVVNFSSGDRDLLYRNDGPIGSAGETTFTDLAATSGIDALESSRPCTLVDYDQDGLLDIFVMSIGTNILY